MSNEAVRQHREKEPRGTKLAWFIALRATK
jgi:hypothetical protein